MPTLNILKFRKLLLIAIIGLTSILTYSQNNKEFRAYEDSLNKLGNLILNSKSDSLKHAANYKFSELLEKILVSPNSFEFKFDSLQTASHLYSPDNKFRVFSWELPKTDRTYEYFGFIQMINAKDKQCKLFKLIDKTDKIETPTTKTIDYNNWYGALYYAITLNKGNGKTFYTVLARKGYDILTTKKVIDVISFDKKGNPTFGAPIFAGTKKIYSRIIFEYTCEVVMSLKFNENFNMIIFDHLAPYITTKRTLEIAKTIIGQHQFYAPDLSYDAYEFKDGKWIYKSDYDARNKKNKNDKTQDINSGSSPKPREMYNPKK